MKTIIFIDGENFKKTLKASLIALDKKHTDFEFTKLNFRLLIENALPKIKIDEIRFYGAKLRIYKETAEKSAQLVKEQRKLITHLQKMDINFIMSGNVRMHSQNVEKKIVYTFTEKGVDVRLAVDLVTMACDKKVQRAVIASSDSDLQPAVSELKSRGVETLYLGFASKPNKGLIYTADKTVLFRDNEIVEAVK